MVKTVLLLLVLFASAAQAEIYTWKDSRGVTHYTNSTVEIPARYRAKAKVLNLGPEQKDQSAAPPASSPAPPAAAVPASPPGAGTQIQLTPSNPSPAAVPAPPQRDRRPGVRQSTAVLETD
ncbi:DUF4124 domain-containing protein [Geotalea sp. SG265]|uniref:DUF4124 domain-containing protein n=1 Tax=Geotalea sp. SG265 TaxID=2922867 RepID=UPI001FAE81E7|nr:DUF4124 domain-containing protein [Geotalea sp. SG265]